MSVEDLRGRLPLKFERQFRPWSYRATQRRLDLRSDYNFEFGDTVYVTFFDVLAMQIRHRYDRLQIAEMVEVSTIDQFADVPERHSDRLLRLSVGDGSHEGFVMCAVFEVRIEPPTM